MLAVCRDHGVAVVPQGGNTGLVGGGVPRGGEVVVSLTRLTELAVDEQQGEAIVGAGVVLEHLQADVRAAGWDLAVDLSSRGSCTIGGMVATNAGGEHVLRYGAMVDQVIGVEAALADGSLVGRVPALRKDNTGYHWDGVLAGSEGTLGVITRVHLRLVPRLTDRVVALLGVADLGAAVAVGARLRRELDELVALEVALADGIELVAHHSRFPHRSSRRAGDPPRGVRGAPWGDGRSRRAPGTRGRGRRRRCGRRPSPPTRGPGAQFWAYREGHAERARMPPACLTSSTSPSPSDALAGFEPAVRARVAAVAPDARVILFGHVGDGNLHVNVLGVARRRLPGRRRGARPRGRARGLASSAEHGIGVAKRDGLHPQHSCGRARGDAGAEGTPSTRPTSSTPGCCSRREPLGAMAAATR